VIVFILAFFLRKSQAMPAKKKQLNPPQTKIDFKAAGANALWNVLFCIQTSN